MINQAIHTLDLMQLIGGEIKSIRGTIDTLSNYKIDVEDTATANINFKNHAKGLFFATNVNYENSGITIEVVFEQGNFLIRDGVLTKINGDGEAVEIIEDSKLPGSKFYYGASHAKLIHRFYDCIEYHLDDYVHVKDAFVSMEMIDAIRKSSDTHQEVMI